MNEVVQSHTFVLAKTYETARVWPRRILHIDAYRLERFEDLGPLRWNEEVADQGTLILLEWPECVAPLSPVPDLSMTFSVTADRGREATVLAP